MSVIGEERKARLLAQSKKWGAFYRANPQRFAEDYLHLHLKTFQKILLYMMNVSDYFVFIAARGLGKTFLCAVFCAIRCILYPGTRVCIASGTRGQALLVILKIKDELMKMSRELSGEIENIHIAAQDAYIDFKNGSVIKVVTASDSARGNRANILIVDEFRMVDKDTIDTVLRKFLSAPRQPGFLAKNPVKYAKYKEENKQMYLSSAYFTSHWCYQKTKDYAAHMLNDMKKYFCCGFPYQLSISEGLLSANQVADEMSESDFNEIKWEMEMCGFFYGQTEGAFFDFESISNNRKIRYPMLPDELAIKVNNSAKVAIPQKVNGEIRLLCVDLALMASSNKKHNDATAEFIIQMMPTKSGRYINNVPYAESMEGEHTQDQALRIRKLYEMYSCDYIVIDGRGLGIGVCDALIRDITDPTSGEVYPALSCCNDDTWASRCESRNAAKALWIINANERFNSDAAYLLREGFKMGRIHLLQTEYDGESSLVDVKGWSGLELYDRLKLEQPYIETTMLINELINLEHEEVNGVVKISKRPGMRKDRYSALSYGFYVSTQLEAQRRRRSSSHSDNTEEFLFRAPKIK